MAVMPAFQQSSDFAQASQAVRDAIISAVDKRCEGLSCVLEQRSFIEATITTLKSDLASAKNLLDQSQAKIDSSPKKILCGKIAGGIAGLFSGATAGATGAFTFLSPAASPVGGAFGAFKGATKGWSTGEKLVKKWIAPKHEQLAQSYSDVVQRTVLQLPNLIEHLKVIAEKMPPHAAETYNKLQAVKTGVADSGLASTNPLDYVSKEDASILFEDLPADGALERLKALLEVAADDEDTPALDLIAA